MFRRADYVAGMLRARKHSIQSNPVSHEDNLVGDSQVHKSHRTLVALEGINRPDQEGPEIDVAVLLMKESHGRGIASTVRDMVSISQYR